MKKRGILTIVIMALFLVALSFPIGAKAASYKWVSVDKAGNMKCYKNGKTLVKNAWVGDRHLGSNGFMDRNKWLKKKVNGVSKTVFVRDDGRWVKNFRAGWQKIGTKYYYYTAKGVLVRSKWITFPLIGKYYVNKYGYRLTGLRKMSGGYRYFSSEGISQTGWHKINNRKYYFQPKSRYALAGGIHKLSNGKSFCFAKNGVMLTGWQKRNGNYYYFKNAMKTGWLTLGTKKYYLAANGVRVSGIYGVDGKLYYFDPSSGEMQKSKTVTYNGRKYKINANGVCTLVPDATNKAPSEKMLFFLTFESGSEAYNQTGGDGGRACGAYQFDYRYALLPFVKYAYSQNAKLCAEFKIYAGYSSGSMLLGNTAFYNAWKKIYKRNPKKFAELQDTFAKVNYYDPVERALANEGINIASRPDVVKGAVYSYSIQGGQTTAVNAVKACKITSATSDKDFLKKLYSYRIKQYPAYKLRYSAEYSLALTKL